MTKVFITKYALTRGIIEKTGIIEKGRFYVGGFFMSYGAKETFLTREEAVKDAEKRRLKKIQSLEKQIKKLKQLKF